MPQNNALLVYKGGWEELQNAVFTDNVSPALTLPASFFIRPDGTTLFSVNFTDKTVETFPLSIPWDVNTLGALGNTFDITDDPFPEGIFFKDDGTKMFIVGDDTSRLYEYALPIPYDVTSIVAPSVNLDLSALPGFVKSCVFSRDGDFVFITANNDVFSFALPTPWDVTSASPTPTATFDPGAILADGITFKPQGDRMYLTDDLNDNIIEYTLSTPYDITTAVFVITISTGAIRPLTIQFRSNGQEFFVLDLTADTISRFHTDLDWSISTASIFTNSKAAGTTPVGINWKHDGTRMIVLDNADTSVKDFSTSDPWNLSTSTQVNTFDVSIAIPNVVGMDWKPDGTRCYVINNVGLLVEFKVGTPWDVSTMTDTGITKDFGVLNVRDIFFRPDGKKLFIIESSPTIFERVNEFDLSTAFDITTISSVVNSLDVIADSPDITGVTFKLDGKIMYFSNGNGLVTRYSLSVPWNVSTGVFVDSIDLSAQDSVLEGLFIRQHDGKKLFTAGDSTNTIYCHDMSLEFNNAIITSLGEEIVDDTGAIIVHTS